MTPTALGLVAATLALAPAAARADFSAPAIVAAERAPMTPAVSGAPDGRVALAWMRLNGSGSPDGIRLGMRGPGPGGQFGAVEAIADGPVGDAYVAIGSGGHVAVLWEGYGGGLFVRRRTPDGVLGAAEAVLDPPARPSSHPQAVAVDDAGNTIVAWAGDDGRIVIRWAHAGQPFGPPEPLSNGAFVAGPTLAITGTGRALVGYGSAASLASTTADARMAFVAPVALDGAPGAAHQLAAGTVAAGTFEGAPQLAVSRGRVLAGWTRSAGGFLGAGELMTAAVAPDGTASAQRTVFAGSLIASADVALGVKRAAVGWLELTSGIIGAAVGDDAASLGKPFAAAGGVQEARPFGVGVDSAGNAVLVWSLKTGGGTIAERETDEIRSVTIPAGRATPCGARALATGTFGAPALVMDGAGGGLAVWSEHVAGSIVGARWSAAGTTCPAAPAGPAAPVAVGPIGLAAARTTVRVARHPVVRVKLRCQSPAACRGPATLKAHGLTLASGRLKIAAGKGGTLVLKPHSDKARRRLRRTGTVAATLDLKLATAGAPSQHATLPLTLRIRR